MGRVGLILGCRPISGGVLNGHFWLGGWQPEVVVPLGEYLMAERPILAETPRALYDVRARQVRGNPVGYTSGGDRNLLHDSKRIQGRNTELRLFIAEDSFSEPRLDR